MAVTAVRVRREFSPVALAQARQRAELGRRRLAALADVAEAQIGFWERGEHIPTLTNAIRLADTIGCSLDDFCVDAD